MPFSSPAQFGPGSTGTLHVRNLLAGEPPTEPRRFLLSGAHEFAAPDRPPPAPLPLASQGNSDVL